LLDPLLCCVKAHLQILVGEGQPFNFNSEAIRHGCDPRTDTFTGLR